MVIKNCGHTCMRGCCRVLSVRQRGKQDDHVRVDYTHIYKDTKPQMGPTLRRRNYEQMSVFNIFTSYGF